jgi:predicted DNA-binding transcriptional regulator YafY
MNQHDNYGNGGQKRQMHYSPSLVNTIKTAVDGSYLTTLEYDSREKGVSVRDVEPMALVYRDGKRNLVGFCHLRNEYRAFRLDRVNMIKFGNKHFDPRNDFNIEDFDDHSGNANQDDAEFED